MLSLLTRSITSAGSCSIVFTINGSAPVRNELLNNLLNVSRAEKVPTPGFDLESICCW